MDNRKITIPIVIVLVLAVISLGIAFATFATTLNINGSASVNASNWEIVFEGLTNTMSISSSSPETVVEGTATEITHPTIKRNSTEISDYEVTLKSPGDSITYNFKIHNRGTYSARVTGVDIKDGIYLVTDTAKRTSAASTLNNLSYKLYYTDNNALVGSGDAKDCLAPGEEENVTLELKFLPSSDTSVLPTTDLVLDDLGVEVIYTQEDSCSSSSGGGTNPGGDTSSITPTPTGGGSSAANPSKGPDGLTGARVSIPNSGDGVTYSVEYILDECNTIESVTLPSTSDLLALNPGLNASDLEYISIALTDANGNSVVGTQIQANTPTVLNLIVSNNGATLNDVINVPDIDIEFADDCTGGGTSHSGIYLVSATRYEDSDPYTDVGDTFDYSWGSYSDFSTYNNGQAPNAFIKNINGVKNTCVSINDTEYCISGNDFISQIGQLCNSISGTYVEDNDGSDGYSKECSLTIGNDRVVITYLYGIGAEFGYTSPTGPFWILTAYYGNKHCSLFNWDSPTDNGYCNYNETVVRQ